MRDNLKRRKKRRRGKQLVPVSPKERKVNPHASKWTFAELQGFLLYKAGLAGSVCIKIDADYTRHACPKCGHTSKENCPKPVLLFVCQNPKCHSTLHADLGGARNIALRTLLIRQGWTSTGTLEVDPDVTDRQDTSRAPLPVRGSAVESSHKLFPARRMSN